MTPGRYTIHPCVSPAGACSTIVTQQKLNGHWNYVVKTITTVFLCNSTGSYSSVSAERGQEVSGIHYSSSTSLFRFLSSYLYFHQREYLLSLYFHSISATPSVLHSSPPHPSWGCGQLGHFRWPMSRAIDHHKVSLLHLMKIPVRSLCTCKVFGGPPKYTHTHIRLHKYTHMEVECWRELD